jgi:hypothetical protein
VHHCVVWLGSVAAVLILVAGFVIWRLMQGPIALDWLAPYIEAGLERSGIGFKVVIGGVRLGIDRATQHAVEHLTVRQISQAVVRRQIFDPLIGLGLFVGAVEILQCERNVVDEPLQQLRKLGRERILLTRHERHHADDLPMHPQRE